MILTSALSCQLDGCFASDLAVVNAARISLNTEHPEINDLSDPGLIGFLMREGHGSPFEHGYFKFKLDVPIFEFRDHVRHRAGHSYNEMSGRYTELEPKFYLPEQARRQEGKPGAYHFVEVSPDSMLSIRMRLACQRAYEAAWKEYQFLLDAGVAKEQARIVLPVGIFTKVIWSCNPRSLMHFLSLRNDKQAMKEIRIVAEQAELALADAMPLSYAAFVSNERRAP